MDAAGVETMGEIASGVPESHSYCPPDVRRPRGSPTKRAPARALSSSTCHVKRAVVERIDLALHRFWTAVDQQFQLSGLRHLVAQPVQLPEPAGRVDVQQWEGQRPGIERLLRQMWCQRAVLADRIEHDRPLGLGEDLADQVDRLRLEAREVSQGCSIG